MGNGMFSSRRSRSNGPNTFRARYAGVCSHCRFPYAAGKFIVVDLQSDPAHREYMHARCSAARAEGETSEETRKKIRFQTELKRQKLPEGGNVWEAPERVEKHGGRWTPDEPFA